MYVAGIDAHTRYLVLVVVNKSGERVLGPVRIGVEQQDRLLAVCASYPSLECVMETSSSWPWLYELLSGAGVTLVLAHAKRLRAIAEANYKRDEIDAELLARMQLAGLIPRVYPTPFTQREWATLIRHRVTLVAQRTALINRIHAQLHIVGLHIARGRLQTRKGRAWVRTSAWPKLGSEQQRLIRTHFRLIAQIQPLVRALDRRIAQVAAQVPEALLLQTVPGIGPYRSLLICAEALPVARFATPGHLVSYAGLAPTSTRSGQRPVRYGSLPRGANRWLRGALVRAIVTHVQCAPDSWLSHYYAQQKVRVGWQVARIAAARRLARALHAVLRTGTPWMSQQPQRGELHFSHAALTA
jgi:transposase